MEYPLSGILEPENVKQIRAAAIPIVIPHLTIKPDKVWRESGSYAHHFPDQLTKIIHISVCYEPPGDGTTWHTHPPNIAPGITNEDLWYCLRGKGIMPYKRAGEIKSLEFKARDIVHSKHLTNYTFNTGNEWVVIPYFGVPHIPFEAAWDEYKGSWGDMPEERRLLDPPVLVHEKDCELVYPFPEGKAAIRPLITWKTKPLGSVMVNAGMFIAEPRQGSDWHSHPMDVWKGFPEEDASYVIKGRGTLYYRLDEKEYEIPIKEGDFVFTGHLPHCIRNTGTEQLVMYSGLCPIKRAIAGEIPEICP